MFRLRRGRTGWAVPVLLFLSVLIVAALAFNLANLDTGDETAPATPAGGTSPGSLFSLDPTLVDVLLVVFGGALFATTVYMMIVNRVRRKRPAKRATWWEVLSSVLGLVMVMALLFAWPRLVRGLRPANETAATTTTGTDAGNLTAWPASVGAPLGLFLAVSVLATILALTYLLRRQARAFAGDEDETDGRDDRRKATEAVQAAIVELELGGDVRQVILACFDRFCRLLGARGITDQSALTPRELERLAIARLQVSPESSGTLTSLFEEARYSQHAMGEMDRERAIDSLAGIRAALEA